MQLWEIVLYLATLLCGSIAQESEGEGSWNYGNEARWGGECTTGDQQSPINLMRGNATTKWRIFPLSRFDSVEFLNYDEPADGNFTNTGHTVQMNLEYNDPFTAPRTVLTADGSTSTFWFRSLHFHWPSEHYINDKQYALEMHMVHSSDDGRLLVLGYMFHVCRRASSGMEVVGASVNRLSSVGSTVSISQFAPERIMPGRLEQCGYFMYDGSLTTPPCTEGVTWLVRQEPLCIEQWELNAFMNVTNADGSRMAGNARSLQDINGRAITYYRCVLVQHWRFFWWWW